MEPDIEELRKNYESFNDDKLLRLATEEATELRPEALALLKKILKERGLYDNASKSIDVQFEKIDDDKLTAYCNIIRELPCPICKSNQEKLNATMIGTALGIISSKKMKIACPNCLNEEIKKANRQSLLWGLWKNPFGILLIIKSFSFNNKMRKNINQNEASDILKTFIIERVGRIEAARDNPTELQTLIKDIR